VQPKLQLLREDARAKSFDVVCAGDALWKVSATGVRATGLAADMRVSPSGGAVDVALALAREGLRVGLSTVIADDGAGRASLERATAAGVDIGGVALVRRGEGVVLVDAAGGANEAQADLNARPPFEVPAGWTSKVLLLSGLSPVIAHAAALCKAARRAKRVGALVVIDFNASMHLWLGRDPRTIRMVLREVDVARGSLADLAVLGMDVAAVRAALRPSAVLVVSHGGGRVSAAGPFGEVSYTPRESCSGRPNGVGDAFTAALCAELTRPGHPGESVSAAWFRALKRGDDGAQARAAEAPGY
jgi:sugar/nucleoside kinase (ribokinase family)